jgi:hypothetical protein
MRPGRHIVLGSSAVVACALAPQPVLADAPNPAIAGITYFMPAPEVRHKLGKPLSTQRTGSTRVWHYVDGLTVWLRIRGDKHYPRRLRVVGVRTTSPRDRFKLLKNVHVGSSAGLLESLKLSCFSATIDDPALHEQHGRFCQYPTYYNQGGSRFTDPGVVVWMFAIRFGRVANVTVQPQSRRR